MKKLPNTKELSVMDKGLVFQLVFSLEERKFLRDVVPLSVEEVSLV